MTLGEFSMLLGMVGALPYIAHILWGKVRPERATWFVWTVILALAIGSYLSSGATDSLWFLVGDFVVTVVIFLLSLWRGRGGWTRPDLLVMSVAGVSILLWAYSGISLFALWGVLIADVVAMIPTLIKSLKDPYSESVSTYGFSSVAALCGFVAVGQWNLNLLFYPAYLFLANFVVALAVWVGQYQLARTNNVKEAVYANNK